MRAGIDSSSLDADSAAPVLQRAAAPDQTQLSAAVNVMQNGADTAWCPPRLYGARRGYSCAGSGSMVFASTGTCTSSLNGVVIMNTRILGKASMKLK